MVRHGWHRLAVFLAGLAFCALPVAAADAPEASAQQQRVPR
jgi:hypothetical protein